MQRTAQIVETTKEYMRGKKRTVLDWPSQFPDINPTEHVLHANTLPLKFKGKFNVKIRKLTLEKQNTGKNEPVATVKR